MIHPPLQRFRAPILTLIAVLSAGGIAHADVTGFGDFSNFTINVPDAGSAPTIAPGVIHLTNTGFNENRSVIANTPQNITQFTASFTYQNTGFLNGYGATFILENEPAGATAVGGVGLNLGYPGGSKTAGITLEQISSPTTSGFYTSTLGGGSSSTSPVNLDSGNPINVTISYNGTTLHENLVDTTTLASYDAFFITNLPTVLGGPTAFVGVTASTNGDNDGTQTFSNFQFTSGSSVPEPASLSLLALAGIPLLMRRRRA